MIYVAPTAAHCAIDSEKQGKRSRLSADKSELSGGGLTEPNDKHTTADMQDLDEHLPVFTF